MIFLRTLTTMMTRSLTYCPAIPALTICVCLAQPVQAQQVSNPTRPTQQSTVANRDGRKAEPVETTPATRARSNLFRRSSAPETVPAPRSASSNASQRSQSPTPTETRSTSIRRTSNRSEATDQEATTRRNRPIGFLGTDTEAPSRDNPGNTDSKAASHTSELDTILTPPRNTQPATMVAARLDGVKNVNNTILSSSLPDVLSPADSSRHLGEVSRFLRASGFVDSSTLVSASERISRISLALDAGCKNLDPGCRIHARLVRRSLDSVSTLLSESALENDSSKLHLAVERLDNASRTLNSLDQPKNR
jgi:hypothetical protein